MASCGALFHGHSNLKGAVVGERLYCAFVQANTAHVGLIIFWLLLAHGHYSMWRKASTGWGGSFQMMVVDVLFLVFDLYYATTGSNTLRIGS